MVEEYGFEKVNYSASLEPSSRSLRDAFLRSFSKDYKLGKLFTESGGVLFEGKTTVEWMQFFKVIPPSGLKNLSILDLQDLFMKLAQAFHHASSFHSSLYAAAETLQGIIDEHETDFIDNELKQYVPGGRYWDDNAKKLTAKKPSKVDLEKMAQNSIREMRKALRSLRMEVSFFEHIMASLEAQRRCFKESGELRSNELRRGL